jgi:hypothetical protein
MGGLLSKFQRDEFTYAERRQRNLLKWVTADVSYRTNPVLAASLDDWSLLALPVEKGLLSGNAARMQLPEFLDWFIPRYQLLYGDSKRMWLKRTDVPEQKLELLYLHHAKMQRWAIDGVCDEGQKIYRHVREVLGDLLEKHPAQEGGTVASAGAIERKKRERKVYSEHMDQMWRAKPTANGETTYDEYTRVQTAHRERDKQAQQRSRARRRKKRVESSEKERKRAKVGRKDHTQPGEFYQTPAPMPNVDYLSNLHEQSRVDALLRGPKIPWPPRVEGLREWEQL